jgi:hypothetical protein
VESVLVQAYTGYVIEKSFDDIKADDIAALVANRRSERRTLEYKQQLPSDSEKDRHDFPADVSSFANAAGGDIVYGIADKRDAGGQATGVPEKVVGLGSANLGQAILRLEQMRQSSISPRINGVHMRAIEGLPEGPVIVVRVPQSWLMPHMVTYNQSGRFYSRNSGGKYQLDVEEIRAGILRSDALPDRIRAFRNGRLARIVADETPYRLSGQHRIVLHMAHLSAFDPRTEIDFLGVTADKLPPMYSSGWNHRINFDGLLTYSPFGEGGAHSYTQLFRNGLIEATESRLLEPHGGDQLNIPSHAYEVKVIEAVRAYSRLFRSLEIAPPWFAMLSLIGVRGFRLAVRNAWPSDTYPIDRDTLVVPEVMTDDADVEAHTFLKPAFDAVWQAGGFHESYNYADDGRWVGQPG